MQKDEPKYPVQLTSLQLLLQIFALGHFYQRAVHVVINYKTIQPAFIKDINTLGWVGIQTKMWLLDHKTIHKGKYLGFIALLKLNK